MSPAPEEGREREAAGFALMSFPSGSSVVVVSAYKGPLSPAKQPPIKQPSHFQTCSIITLDLFYGSSLTTAAEHQKDAVTFHLGSPSVRAVLEHFAGFNSASWPRVTSKKGCGSFVKQLLGYRRRKLAKCPGAELKLLRHLTFLVCGGFITVHYLFIEEGGSIRSG